MVESSIQHIAADASVISIALLGVTLLLIGLTWKGFSELFPSLPPNERRELVKSNLIYLILTFFVFCVFTAVGVKSPNMFPLSYFLVMLGLAVILVLWLLFVGIQRLIYCIMGRKKKSKVVKVDPATSYYFSSMLILSLSAFCCVFALLAIIMTALDINIGPDQTNNFLLGKWLLADGVVFFTAGIFLTAWTYLYGKTRNWRKRS